MPLNFNGARALPPLRPGTGRGPCGCGTAAPCSSVLIRVVRAAVGRVARQNGPVARSTRNSIA